MNDRVSFLEVARCKLDSRKCTKQERRQLETDLASASYMVQCERDKISKSKVACLQLFGSS